MAKPIAEKWALFIGMFEKNNKQLAPDLRIALQDAFYAGAASMGTVYLEDAQQRQSKRFPEAIAEVHRYGVNARQRKG